MVRDSWLVKGQRIRDCRLLSPERDPHFTPLPSKARGSLRKQGQKECKSQTQCATTKKTMSSRHSMTTVHINPWTSMNKACASTKKTESQHGERTRTRSPIPSKGILAFSSIWEESQFSLRVLFFLNWPHSSWRPHIQEYVLITNWVC